MELKERFESKLMRIPEVGCWIWLGAVNNDGYGIINVNHSTQLAHRTAWKLFNNTIPNGRHVLHRCDVRCCVNPEHLFLGSHTDNMRDCAAKGRRAGIKLYGERNGQAKLTQAAVDAIRKDERKLTKIAADYGVHFGHISAIKRGRRWT